MNSETPQKCCWTDDGGEAWETGCGNLFVIIDDTPLKNGMKFCCFCGKPLTEAPLKTEEEE